MKPMFLAALALALPLAPVAAQAPNWAKAQQLYVTMGDEGYTPARLVLRRNTPYVLHVTNRSRQGHNLTQEAFFRLARVAPADRVWTRTGKVSLDSGQRAIIRLVAPATRPGGRYQFSSTVLGDAGKEYKGAFLMR